MTNAENPESIAQAEQRLEAERLRIQRLITDYPLPAPACDAYFNHLLEQRALICDELAAVRGAQR